MKVLIDNGHGANTPGKRSPDGRLREYAYAREIAERLEAELRKLGIEAERIVHEELDVPLSERVRRVNEYKSSEALLVSIHVNAAGMGDEWKQARGWECWTSPGRTKADKLATCLYEAARQLGIPTREDNSDGDPDKEGHLYILQHTRCPAVLTENLFQDNREDVEWLLSAAGKASIVELHVRGITSYLMKNEECRMKN